MLFNKVRGTPRQILLQATLTVVLSLSTLTAKTTLAEVKVAFFPSPDELHRNIYGQFYHVAIKAHGHWWESHPFYGVQKSEDLMTKTQAPEVHVLIAPDSWKASSEEELLSLEGIPFDLHSDWYDLSTLYCTEFAAHVLGVSHYAKPIVEEGFRIGELGLSPDELYQRLLHEAEFRRIQPKNSSKLFCVKSIL